MTVSNRFVLVDGLDYSGKTTVINTLREWAVAKSLRILDLKEYCQKYGRFPEPTDLDRFDVIVSSEPSYSFVGKAIREELIKENERKYSAQSLAMAFALDREILYRRVILPAMEKEKYVFQERGLISSLVYQPVQEHITIADLMRLPGNRLAMENSPGVIIITRVSSDYAMQRLQLKLSKTISIFDNLLFQRKIEERYSSLWLKGLFEKQGSMFFYIDNNPPKTADTVRNETLKLWESVLNEENTNNDVQKSLM
jgi:thymidylate kinase